MGKVNIAGYTVSANPMAPNSLFQQDGGGGQGVTFVPKLTETSRGYELSWTNDGGLPNPDPVEITNGTDGTPGTDGENGATFVPSVTSVQGGHKLSWTNDGGKQNPDPVEIMNGTDGAPGTDGENGATFIPSVTAVQGGHKLSWTNDKGLPNPPDVTILDGEGGEGGNVPAGGTAGQFLKKASADDYATEWGTVHEVPAGGGLDQVLAKASGTDFDLKWVTPSGGGGGGVWEVTEDATEADLAVFHIDTDKSVDMPYRAIRFNLSDNSFKKLGDYSTSFTLHHGDYIGVPQATTNNMTFDVQVLCADGWAVNLMFYWDNTGYLRYRGGMKVHSYSTSDTYIDVGFFANGAVSNVTRNITWLKRAS